MPGEDDSQGLFRGLVEGKSGERGGGVPCRLRTYQTLSVGAQGEEWVAGRVEPSISLSNTREGFAPPTPECTLR